MSKTPKKAGLFSGLNCASGKSKKNPPITSAPPSTPPDTTNSYANDPEVSHEVLTVAATPGHGAEREEEVSYTDIKPIGKGTFGVVYRAKLVKTDEMVAIKKVFHNEKFKNRELQMLRLLQHPNVIKLHYFFYSNRPGCRKDELYLNMIMEFIPETLWSIAQCDGTNRPLMDLLYVKLYMYQLFRCLVYLHSLGICHRDIKPQNLLLNPETHVIKLCDFGSAKELIKGETNVAYICSRYYRAPELILGATDYTLQIDVWSAGCVLAELLLGQPIFPGATAADQLVEIIKILGTPTVEDFNEINRNYQNFQFPHLRPQDWRKVLTKSTTTPEAVDLVSHVLLYLPSSRLTPIEVIGHPFFAQLREPQTRLRHNKRLPPLFNFTREELNVRPDMNDLLIPEHARHQDGDNDLADFQDLNLSEHPVEASDTSLLGKFRSSLKKKVSIKRLSDIVKSPHSKAGSKKGKTANAEAQQPNQDETVEPEIDGGNDANYSNDFSGSIDIETREDTGEMPAPDEEAQDTSVVKKKKKKKKKQREVQNYDEAPVDDDDYAANGDARERGHLTQSLDASGYDTDDVDNGHVSIDHTAELHHGDEEHEVAAVTKTTKTKKHRQRPHRTQQQVADEEPEEL